MCGIAGVVSLRPIDVTEVISMTDKLSHRGPNDEGYLVVSCNQRGEFFCKQFAGKASPLYAHRDYEVIDQKGICLFGHKRLSILDLSPLGHQPMRSEQGCWIVFNGEIYNYIELRSELQSHGYQFSSETDTEVILAAYDYWGMECCSRFNGDWAFALFDPKMHKVLLSRDRYGTKPLFYLSRADGIYFASEIKALFSVQNFDVEPNDEVLAEYLCYGLLDHRRETTYCQVNNVLPGECIEIDIDSLKIIRSSYYNLPSAESKVSLGNSKIRSIIDDVRSLLIDSVKLRLRADVPVGACLSGGLDSSAILGCISYIDKYRTEELHAFTASFPDTPIDESRYAKCVADYVHAKHHLIYPTQKDFKEAMDVMHDCQDEPYGGPSVYSQHLVMKEASRFVTVLLDGQGGDEVMGGYRVHRSAYLAELARSLQIGRFVKEISALIFKTKGELEVLKHVPFYLLPRGIQSHVLLKRRQQSPQREFLRKFELTITQTRHLQLTGDMFTSDARAMYRYMLYGGALTHLLRYEDRNSMHHSIEARVPFLDFRLVDYMYSLPRHLLIRDGWTKWLLRKAVEDLIPSEIVWRRDKLGYATPTWLNHIELGAEWLRRIHSRKNPGAISHAA